MKAISSINALLFTLIISGMASRAPAQTPDANTVSDKRIVIILVGDSTVADRTGWGLGFKQFLDTNKVECINVAAGGRSSMSFMREGRWTNALVLRGDYYLIQFGHNNDPGKPGRSTDMATFVRNMEQYVDDARAIGAQPILVTPLTRRQWDPANPGRRVKWSKQLSKEEADAITVPSVLNGDDGWNPTAEADRAD